MRLIFASATLCAVLAASSVPALAAPQQSPYHPLSQGVTVLQDQPGNGWSGNTH